MPAAQPAQEFSLDVKARLIVPQAQRGERRSKGSSRKARAAPRSCTMRAWTRRKTASYDEAMTDAVPPPASTIAVVVLTHDRLHLVRKCYENVLARTSPAVTEIVIWDNASTDGTGEFLAGVADERLQVVRNERNIGQNGYAEAVKRTTAPYIVEIDDDVTNAPEGWDAMLLDAFRRLPDIGFLAADLEDDPNDIASYTRHHVRPHEYVPVVRNGVNLLEGPAGGGCAMTSRRVYDEVGGFPQQRGKAFYLEDAAYIGRVRRAGYSVAVLGDLRVHHTGGDYYSQTPKAKADYWRRYERRVARRSAAKRALVTVPFVRRFNARFHWFLDPDAPEAPPSAH
jgi:GT2 family glycosyltransferase